MEGKAVDRVGTRSFLVWCRIRYVLTFTIDFLAFLCSYSEADGQDLMRRVLRFHVENISVYSKVVDLYFLAKFLPIHWCSYSKRRNEEG